MVSFWFALDVVRIHGVFLSSICSSVVPKSDHYHMSNYTKSPYFVIQSGNQYEPDRPILGMAHTE